MEHAKFYDVCQLDAGSMAELDIAAKKLSDDVSLPSYAHAGDAGLDLRSTITVTLKPFERMTVPCGFSLAIPDGYAGLVLPRSGLASKWGVTVANAPGLIDSGYRGEIKVALVNMDAENEFTIEAGDRVAQLVVIKVPTVTLTEVDLLDITSRNEKGFGSSGVM